MLNLNRFYTYAYLREDGTPYYIGKGGGNRIYCKHKGEVKPSKNKSRIIFLKRNLTEEEAFKHEIYMINVFGRKDLGTGILRNKTNGGEGSSGAIISNETRQKQSEKRRGKKQTEKHKKNRSNALKGRVCCSPEAIERMKQTKRKLLPEQVKEIKNSSEKGILLASKYNITPSLVSQIRNGKATGYKHII